MSGLKLFTSKEEFQRTIERSLDFEIYLKDELVLDLGGYLRKLAKVRIEVERYRETLNKIGFNESSIKLHNQRLEMIVYLLEKIDESLTSEMNKMKNNK